MFYCGTKRCVVNAAIIEMSSMKIGIPRESFTGEKRVAITPEIAEKLIALGFTVAIEPGAGVGSNYADDMLVKPSTLTLSSLLHKFPASRLPS